MINGKKVLAIIPARGGSKTVLKKNIRKLNGKPLIYYSINQGKESELIDRVIVSTDDGEIQKVSESFDCEVQVRPDELAQDTTPTLPVLQHVVKKLEEQGFKADIIILLQPTSPFRKKGEIDRTLKKFYEEECNSLMSVSVVPDHFSPEWIKKIEDGEIKSFLDNGNIKDDKKYTRKQDLEKYYWKNGGVYIMSYETLIEEDSIFGNKCIPYIGEAEGIVNIDTEEDFALAEFNIKHFNIDL